MPSILALKLDKICFQRLTRATYEYKEISMKQAEWRIAEGKKRRLNDIFSALENAVDDETGRKYTRTELISEAALLIIAGSDTVGTAMSATVFYLLHCPESLARVQHEVRSAFSSLDEINIGSRLNGCEYLFACFDEALRLAPPVPGILAREVLPGGLLIDGVFIPQGIDLGVPIYALHHQERYFSKPWEFQPSRWIIGESGTTEENLKLARSAFTAFGYGRTSCVGKNLAYQEMGLTIARLIWQYDWRLQPQLLPSKSWVWGRDKATEFQLWDKFVTVSNGPMVEFKERVT